MTQDNTALTEDRAIDEELVAYLDGELDAETAARIERRLAEDPRFSARLNQLQRAWDLLDTLQQTEADDDFVHSTVAMVAVQAEQDAKTQRLRAVRRRSLAWLALGCLVLVSAAAGYVGLQLQLTHEDRELLRDLPVIEHVDDYRSIDSLDFVKQLAHENLFPAEVDDGT
jgi:anti-sigma factor RsiW